MGQRVYYFGCNRESGHHMYLPGMRGDHRFLHSNPWGLHVDGGLVRPLESIALHYKDGWTAIAFEDYSVDTRPGSNSVFLAEGEFDTEQMIALAREYFPEIAARLSLPDALASQRRPH